MEASKVKIITGKERRSIVGSCNSQDKNPEHSPGDTDAILTMKYIVYFPLLITGL